jgi:hypothetical protein
MYANEMTYSVNNMATILRYDEVVTGEPQACHFRSSKGFLPNAFASLSKLSREMLYRPLSTPLMYVQ